MDIYLGLDIGGTKCSLVAGDNNFEIKHKITFETRTERGYKLILDEFMKHIDDVLNPECIVIGSIYARNESLFQPEMMRVLRQEAIPAALQVCTVRPAALGDSIGDYAALCVAVYEDKF